MIEMTLPKVDNRFETSLKWLIGHLLKNMIKSNK